MSEKMTEIEQKHQSLGDNVGNNKQTNNHHAPTGISNIQGEKIEMTVNQYNYQQPPKKKRPFNLTIEEDGISPEEAQEYLQIIINAVKRRKGSDKCSINLQFTAEGSTQFILDGDAEDLQILADLQAEGKLEALLNELKLDDMPEIKVKKAEFTEDEEVIKKVELIKDIRDGKAYKKNLIEANLRGANLSRAYLVLAYLIGTDLRGANLDGAYLRGADLYRAIIDDKTQLDNKWRLVHNIVNNNLENTDLHSQDLSFANLPESFLFRANLMGANLSESNLIKANLQEADLSGSNLTNAYLGSANLIDAVFDHAIVKDAKFANNQGITEALKRDLIARGAIFADDSRDRVLVGV